METKKRVLIAEDSAANRALLTHILLPKYEVLEAENGADALTILKKERGTVAAVLLDLRMPVMDGYEFLTLLRGEKRIRDTPVIVMTQDEDAELRALALGASDFLVKPYRPAVILQRLHNILALRETLTLRNTLERDALTGLYNRSTFARRASELLSEHPNQKFDLIFAHIERFKVINDLFGVQEGDHLLCYLAKQISRTTVGELSVCGRLNADRFAVLLPSRKGGGERIAERINGLLRDYPLNIKLTVRFGLYPVREHSEPVSQMCDRAQLAAQSIGGRFDCCFAYYDEQHRNRLLEEQELVEGMEHALQNGEFEVYMQPKYNLTSGEIEGAEALVRWNHPTKGQISPKKFIPLFEKNGFISTLDCFVWEETCRNLSQWAETAERVIPVSVNISRVDIYNPKLADILQGLVEKYHIQPAWLELEITESAYTENAGQLIEVIGQLKAYGFLIEMDDFGSGYSSLNMLGEVPVDVLKIDMRFLQSNAEPGREKNILNFVVSLSKWLGLSVVAEGIETKEQVAFLRSMGCNRGQGYYFSKPLRKAEFETLISGCHTKDVGINAVFETSIDINEIWNPFSQFNLLFNSYVGALGIFEYSAEDLFLLRANENYYRIMTGSRELISRASTEVLERIFEEDRPHFVESMHRIMRSNGLASGDSRWHMPHGTTAWLHLNARVIYNSPDRTLFLCSIEDCTAQKRMEEKMAKQRRFFAQVYDTIPSGVIRFEIASELHIRSANLAAIKMLGYTKESFPRATLDYWSLIKREDLAATRQSVKRLATLPEGQAIETEYRLHTREGKTIWVHDATQIIPDEEGTLVYQTVLTDITQRKEKESELRMVQEQYMIAACYAENYIFSYDPHTGQARIFLKDKTSTMRQITLENVPDSFIARGDVAPEALADYRNFFARLAAGEPSGTAEVRVVRESGEFGWFSAHFYNQFDEDGASLQAICIFTDIDEMKKKELGLYEVAHRDPLTGLYNRKAFEELTTQALQVASSGAFLMLDLDDFKHTNDSYGHAAGDAVLVQVADIIRGCLRNQDLIGRLGGDEFVIFLPNVSSATLAQARSRAICACFANHRFGSEIALEISCSVGIALAPQHGASFGALYRSADNALYEAKKAGKNRCAISG